MKAQDNIKVGLLVFKERNNACNTKPTISFQCLGICGYSWSYGFIS